MSIRTEWKQAYGLARRMARNTGNKGSMQTSRRMCAFFARSTGRGYDPRAIKAAGAVVRSKTSFPMGLTASSALIERQGLRTRCFGIEPVRGVSDLFSVWVLDPLAAVNYRRSVRAWNARQRRGEPVRWLQAA